MAEMKEFPTEVVLSVVTGVLVCDGIGPIYEMLNWMTGESLYTHQLPRVAREAEPVVLAMHPMIAVAMEDAKNVDPSNYALWRTV